MLWTSVPVPANPDLNGGVLRLTPPLIEMVLTPNLRAFRATSAQSSYFSRACRDIDRRAVYAAILYREKRGVGCLADTRNTFDEGAAKSLLVVMQIQPKANPSGTEWRALRGRFKIHSSDERKPATVHHQRRTAPSKPTIPGDVRNDSRHT